MAPQILPDWTFSYVADGLILTPPEGPTRGALRIRQRQTPLRTIRSIVDQRVKELPFAVKDLRAVAFDQLTTEEGDYGGIVSLRARATETDAPLALVYSIVYGDDFYVEIAAASHVPTEFARVEKAVRDVSYYSSLGLGDRRRRWFYYEPPAGWTPYPRAAITEWLPPDFPNNLVMIGAYPVRPIRESSAAAIDRALNEFSWHGFKRESTEQPIPIFSEHRLGGFWCRTSGTYTNEPTTYVDVAIYQDDRYFYVLSMRSHLSEGPHHAAFKKMSESCRPIPYPERSEAGSTFDHWVG